MSAYDPKYIKLPPSGSSGGANSGSVEPVMTSTGELVTLESGDLVTQPYLGG